MKNLRNILKIVDYLLITATVILIVSTFLMNLEILYEKSDIETLLSIYWAMEIEPPFSLIERQIELNDLVANFGNFITYCGYVLLGEITVLIFILNPRKHYIKPTFNLSTFHKNINK